jgi:twitching motility protein PilT
MNIGEILVGMRENNASDLILKVGAPPILRIRGDLQPMELSPVTDEDTEKLITSLMTKDQREVFERNCDLDIGANVPKLARFRISVFRQRGHIGLVFRLIPAKIPTLEQLGLPEICSEFAMRERGLVLVTGPAGCGKSTTIASMLDHRNQNDDCHIVTVEDPIEFIHEDKRAIVNQREVGKDTRFLSNALRCVLRQDPDVILIGDMRDLGTIRFAITAAETGHLVLSTLHTTDAVQTVDRIIDVFPQHAQRQIRLQLSSNLIGVVSQLLLPSTKEKKLALAYEVMVCTASVRTMIREAKTHQLANVIQTRSKDRMVSMNASLARLVRENLIERDIGISNSANPEELAETLKGKPE